MTKIIRVPEAIRTGHDLTETGEVQWLPTPVAAERYYGVTYAASEDERRRVSNALFGYPRVGVDEEIARAASTLLANADEAEGANGGVETNDASIGAVADAVLGANTADFETLDVAVETY